jgi:ribose transport system ATP-binding protein
MSVDSSQTRVLSSAAALPLAAATGNSAISVVGLKKFFGETRALDGCNFSANLGEIHAVVGGNGCGKSTLAKVLSGVLVADSGRVTVLGRAPASPHEARDLGVATVFQEVLVADDCSVVDNLFMGSDGLFSQSMSSSAKIRAGAALMADLTGTNVDVQGLAGVLPLSLKQWITIGRALLRKPKVLILDESSAALDLDSTERLFAKMRELREAGSAVLIVTHRIAELIRISDRATVLRDGRDVGVLERQDITEKNLLALMTGQTEHARAEQTPREEPLRNEIVLRSRGLHVWPGSGPTDFELHRGEIVGVAGLDGQGQREFVRILAGIEAAHEGAAEIRLPDGSFAPIRRLDDAVAHGVSYVSGDRKREGVFSNLSIFENMLLPLYRAKARGGKIGVIDWMSLDGIFNWEAQNLQIRMGARDDKITALSGGNQQKVLIGRGFATNPDIMILDDPARGIDVSAKSELYRHLGNFAAQGKSVVYMSSELEEFIGFCSRVIVFRAGVIFAVFEAAALSPAIILEAMFGQTKGMPIGPSDTGGISSAPSASRLGGSRTFQDARGRPSSQLRGAAAPLLQSPSGASPVATRTHQDRPALRQPVTPPTIKTDAFGNERRRQSATTDLSRSSRRGN